MTKSDPNIHQNAPNCSIKKFSHGSMPLNPPNKLDVYFSLILSPPPMFGHGFTPFIHIIISCNLSHIIVPKYCYVGASLVFG